jgi:hypothetical protein
VTSVFESAITQLLGKLGIDEDEEDSVAGREEDIQEYESITTTSS